MAFPPSAREIAPSLSLSISLSSESKGVIWEDLSPDAPEVHPAKKRVPSPTTGEEQQPEGMQFTFHFSAPVFKSYAIMAPWPAETISVPAEVFHAIGVHQDALE